MKIVKEILPVVVVIFSFFHSLGQNVDSLKQSCSRIQSDGSTTLDESRIKEIGAILSLDVFSYFDLKEYNSELQKKVFKQTEEYKNLLNELKGRKDSLLQERFYFEHWLVNPRYNIQNKSFSFYTTTLLEEFYNAEYIQFGSVCFNKPTGFTILNRRENGYQTSYIEQKVVFKFIDEKKALRVENEGAYVLFVFKFTIAKTKTYNLQNFLFVNYATLLTKIDKVLICSQLNGDILAEFKYTSPSPTSHPK